MDTRVCTLIRTTDFASASYPTLQWLHDMAMADRALATFDLFMDKGGLEYLAAAKRAYLALNPVVPVPSSTTHAPGAFLAHKEHVCRLIT